MAVLPQKVHNPEGKRRRLKIRDAVPILIAKASP